MLMIAYGFVLSCGAKLISDGAEMLLEVSNPVVVGGLVLPILGALPDAAMILVSGLGPDAQEQLSVGVGTLAGSTIMLLTVPWLGGLLIGRCDIGPSGEAIDKKCGKFGWFSQVTNCT
jgi:Ca2+/Na+ antiporter